MVNTEIVIMGYIYHDDKILLVKHKKKNRYMSCGGHLEDNETFIDCLKREIKEEINLDVDILSAENKQTDYADPLPLHIISKDINKNKLIIIEYLCSTKDISKFALKENELLNYIWVKESDIENIDAQHIVKNILRKCFNLLKSRNLINITNN